MFRVPNEHFNAIADIAGQPEASQVCIIKFIINIIFVTNFIIFNN